MTLTAAATLAPSCEARTGVLPGDYGMTPLWCSARIGLITWTDSQGHTHRACRHHVEGMQRRYPVRTDPTARPASPRCESGGRFGCTCDVCF